MYRWIGIKLIFLFIVGCTMDDADRCPNDWLYDKKTKTCYWIGDENSSDSDVTTDAGVLDGGVDSDTETAVDNFGESCSDTVPCVGAADYCLAQPGQAGNCTYTECLASQCPAQYQCCDCTNFAGMPVLCVPDEQVDAFLGGVCSSCE